MRFWPRKPEVDDNSGAVAARVRAQYAHFRELLSANNESLELMAGLQEDLQFAPPRSEVLGDRIGALFSRVEGVVAALDAMTGVRRPTLNEALSSQRIEVERFAAELQEVRKPRLSAWLSEIDASSESSAGAKAAILGEIRNKLNAPVPDGFVLTTEAYRLHAGIPLWQTIRDATRDLDLNDAHKLRSVSEQLTTVAMSCEPPRSVEVAITARSETLLKNGGALAVRSSAVGEGGARSFAGQFQSILNVSVEQSIEAYKRVAASRFSERALYYRLSTGLSEVDSSIAVLFLPVLPARSSGILYTRDPADPKSKCLWITATRGLGLDIASGRMPADLFVVSRTRPHTVLEQKIVHKEEEIILKEGGGVDRRPLLPGAQDAPSLQEGHLHMLAEWGVAIETHFKAPQDIEWVLDTENRLWIVQARPLTNIEAHRAKSRPLPKAVPRLTGGRGIYPGRTSGPVFLVDEGGRLSDAPQGSIVFVRRPSPEIVESFPRIAGLVGEWGNITGHAAALLREFRIPSVFQMPGAFEQLANGEPVSLDAVQTTVYSGILWPASRMQFAVAARGASKSDPIARRLLVLNLIDPSGSNFRPSGCKSAHDVLRYCHEKAIEAMFAINDLASDHGPRSAHKLQTSLPLNVHVLDLGGGLAPGIAKRNGVEPGEIASRPFQALWKGISNPEVTWTREMPAGLADLASVLANSFAPQHGGMRALGEKSYLLIADEYMNLNSRLAYHYSLIDACLSDVPGNNYISFRFEGGGATRDRRNLRACFLEHCLTPSGFKVDRRGDLVNAWFRKAPPDQVDERLGILGRLLACSSQLDMYMTSREIMNWYVEQFLAGNYAFHR